MEDLKIGDKVTRISYNHDTVFRILNIEDNICYLKGENVRLFADSPISDLKLYIKKSNDNFEEELADELSLDRNEYFYMPARILHLDADSDYLNRCLNYYKKNKLQAIGKVIKEEEIPYKINKLLKEHEPDIVIITGHDAYYKNHSGDKYQNSFNFIETVKEARKYEKSQDKLIIVAGACQSNYEELIKSGANFASSPKRINIHALDPAIIATSLAFSDKNKSIDLIKLIEKTKYGSDGIGGIITNGTMYVGYPR